MVKIKLKNGDKSRKTFPFKAELPEGSTSATLVVIDNEGNKSRRKNIRIPEA